jgi:hypothetical protein
MAQSETMFTAAFIAQQRELAEQAAARPWISNWDQPEDSDKLNQIANADGVDVIGVTYYDGELLSISKEDAAYTVAAANNYPAALDEIERLRSENEILMGDSSVLMQLQLAYNSLVDEHEKTCAAIRRSMAEDLVGDNEDALRARVAELEASEARLEKGNAAYEELTRRLVERFSGQIAWSDIIEMQVEISRERK